MAAAIGNLGPRAQTRQLRMGVVFVGIALFTASLLAASGAGAVLRLVVFAPLFLGAYGIYSAMSETCGFCALAKRRLTDDGLQSVADPEALATLRGAGMRIIAASVAIAAGGAALLAIAE